MLKYEILDITETWLSVLLMYTVFYKLMTPKKYTIISASALSSAYMIFYCLAEYSGYDIFVSMRENTTVIFYCSVFEIFLLSVFTFTGFSSDLKRKVRIMFAGISIQLSADFIAGFTIIKILNVNMNILKSGNGKYAIINSAAVLFTGLLVPAVVYWLCKEKDYGHLYRIRGVTVCLSFCAVFFLLITIIYYRADITEGFNPVMFLLCLFFIALFLLSMRAFVRYSVESEKIRSDAFLTKEMQKLALEKLEESLKNDKKIRMVKHDYLDQLMCIKLLISKNTEESLGRAEAIIDSMSGEINSLTPAVFSANISLNIILSAKIAEAAESNVKIIHDISVPESFPPGQERDIDLLMINLLDNAIEGCARSSGRALRTVRFSVSVRGNYLFVRTENPCEESPVRVRGRLITSKPDPENHGIGNSIIESIVQKQKGQDDIITEKGSFIRCVCIELN